MTGYPIRRRYQLIRKPLRISSSYVGVVAVGQMLEQTFFDILGFTDVNPYAFVKQRVHSRGFWSVCENGCAIEKEPSGSVPSCHLTFDQWRTTVLRPEFRSARFGSEITEWSRCNITPQITAASPRLDSLPGKESTNRAFVLKPSKTVSRRSERTKTLLILQPRSYKWGENLYARHILYGRPSTKNSIFRAVEIGTSVEKRDLRVNTAPFLVQT